MQDKDKSIRILRITTVPMSLHLLLRGQLEYMQQQGFEVLTASAAGEEVVHLEKAGVKHTVLPLTRKISPLQDIKALVHTVRLIRRFRPDIIHTHTPKAGVVGMLAAAICRVRVRMHTVGGLPQMDARGARKWALHLTEWITAACAHNVYPNSSGLLDYMRQRYPFVGAKLKMLGKGSSNGIDTSFYSSNASLEEKAKMLRDEHGINASAKVFCFIGRITRDKGINELVSAFRKISINNRYKLLLVGFMEPELDPLDKETILAIEADQNIHCTGYMHDVRIALMASDIFVFPSYREGFPNVVMQAMSMGKPCIVSDINGCNELIRHRKSGWIVPAKDTNALAGAMLSLAEDISLGEGLAKEAQQHVRDNYAQQVIWQLLANEYRNKTLTHLIDPT